jgi:hypothetical protein
MISMGIKMEMLEGKSIEMRRICFAINEILTSDMDEIANLFIIDEGAKKIRCYSEDDE